MGCDDAVGDCGLTGRYWEVMGGSDEYSLEDDHSVSRLSGGGSVAEEGGREDRDRKTGRTKECQLYVSEQRFHV